MNRLNVIHGPALRVQVNKAATAPATNMPMPSPAPRTDIALDFVVVLEVEAGAAVPEPVLLAVPTADEVT